MVLKLTENELRHIFDVMENIAIKNKAPVFNLNFLKTPFQHLVFTVLSSRTRDEVTAEACKRLLSKAGSPEELEKLSVEEIEKLIRGVGFYRVKAKRLKDLSKEIKKLGGVPDTYEELIKLPGVGRKTANVVLASAFGKNAIGVDTHVHRIANRLGIVSTKSNSETEEELKKIIPKDLWIKVNKAMVGFGQTVCKPQNPLCDNCPFKSFCHYSNFNKAHKPR
ncbi:MAG: endonuclease III [Archaeoglobus sp.]|nr:MAG: endonuclease III [Archaeoglobus sp.]